MWAPSFEEWRLLWREVLVCEVSMNPLSYFWGKYFAFVWFFLFLLCFSENGSEAILRFEQDLVRQLSFEKRAQSNALIVVWCKRNRHLKGSPIVLISKVLMFDRNIFQLQLVEEFAAAKLVKNMAYSTKCCYLAKSFEIESPRELWQFIRLLLGRRNQWVNFQCEFIEFAVDLSYLLEKLIQVLLDLLQKFVVRQFAFAFFIVLAHHRFS